MKCEKCGMLVEAEDTYDYCGQKLCEDCYIGIKAMPKTCDPWAVHLAKNFKGNQPDLSPVQGKIMNLLKSDGPLTSDKICETLNITDSEFRNHFATLRHMELARGFKENDQIHYTLFEK